MRVGRPRAGDLEAHARPLELHVRGDRTRARQLKPGNLDDDLGLLSIPRDDH